MTNLGHANGHSKTHNVAYVFKGTYEGNGTVLVAHGNSRVRKGGLIGETVTFDLSNARIVVADTNQDGQRNLDDVQTGDKVLVKARLPRTEPGAQPFAARKLVDQSHKPGS
jgi:DNA-binding beta-propeller fold protein YncE